VVLVTTKSGRSGPTRFTFRSSTSFNDINHTYPLQMLYGQGTGHSCRHEPGRCCDAARHLLPLVGSGDPGGKQLRAPFDHANELYRVGHTFDNGFTVAGATTAPRFISQGTTTTTRGDRRANDYFSRTAARLKATHRVADNLRLGGDLSFADTRARYLQRGNNTNGVQLGFLRTPPISTISRTS